MRIARKMGLREVSGTSLLRIILFE